MNCIEFRRHIGSAPQTQSDDILAHGRECSTCARYADELWSMDGVLRQAMEVDVPQAMSDPAALLQLAQRGDKAGRSVGVQRTWYAVAASALLGVGLVTGLWLGQTTPDLPGALVAHVLHEPGSLRPDLPALEKARVRSVLERASVSLNGDIGDVRYAGLCPFRGNAVPHLVIKGQHGPITVMLLPDETVSVRTPFDEEGFKGVIIPVGRGSIALIGNPDELLEPVDEQFSRSVEFSI